MIRTVTNIHSRHGDAYPLTPRMVAISCALYCPVGLGVAAIDQKFLLMAWFMAGFLGLALYLTVDRRLPLANPGTLFFSATIAGCLAAFVFGVG